MLDTPEAVFEALRENHERPHGLQRTVVAEELAEAAEVFDKPDVLVTALLELMTSYEFTGEHRKAPVVFARLLKLWDTAPESFSEGEAHQVFWRFKWVTTSLIQVPDVPLATIRGWVDRMRERYEAGGHGMQPVAAMRHHIAAHTGVGAADAYDLWITRPRTELSDCEACETRNMARHLMADGDDSAALDAWGPVLDGSQSCSEEPQSSQARALLPLLRTGRTDEARSHHLTGYRRVRGNTGMQQEVGLHLEFCALSRNEGRGLEVLAENRGLFEATGAPLARLGFLTGVEVLLARIVAQGHGDVTVAGPPGRNWTAAGLLGHVRAEAEPLAAAFDTRNGTTAVGDRRKARLAQEPLLAEPLPLGLRTAVVRPAAGPGATDTPASGTAPASPSASPSGVAIPEDFVELVREARRLSGAGQPSEHRLWERIAERMADGSAPDPHDHRLGPRELLEAELADHRADGHGNAERRTEFAAEQDRAAGLFTRAGMPWHALAARANALAWGAEWQEGETAGREETAAGIDALLAEAERLAAEAPFTGEAPGAGETAVSAHSGNDVGRTRVLHHLMVLNAAAYSAYREVLEQLPEPSEAAVARFDAFSGRLRTESERLSAPHQTANARQYVADLAARRGDLALAEAELRAALADVAAAGRPWRGSRPRCLLAQFLLARHEPDEAVELLHQAIGDAVRHDDAGFPLAPSYALLGHAASHQGDFGGAVRHLSEAAARYDQDGDREEATDVRLQLADVLARAGQQADAVAVLESVLSDETAEGLDERMLAQARLTLARGLRELGEQLPAAEEFLRLADTVAGWEDDRAVHTLVAAEAAVTLALADRWDAAASAYDRAVAAHAEAGNPPMLAHMMREFARLTVLAREEEGVDAALEHLARADALLAAEPQDTEDFALWYEQGSVHYRRGRVLAEAQRFPEALEAVEAAIAAHERGGEEGEVPRAEAVRIAALIEGNGLERRAAAVTRLAAAAARCRAGGLPEAADILDALRQEFQQR
ncbi:hypothetical protein KV205_34160 [Streptomyces sp. SKN60]|uniref:hypothetical protein n=1 Tax=Streptomyces sp. SKN60 TaxID=2855506 RepID=UPI0022474613|nr:hypothetical protein [Streptomyces sp. SKN60]MCX2185517.1 hypothetical protein [Streptomyces sp. SKN60]